MMRLLRLGLAGWLPMLALGCQTMGTSADLPPVIPIGEKATCVENPTYVPLPPRDYDRVFQTALQVLGDYGFEIAEANRYSGHIEAVPRTAPGIALLLKPGSPDLYERLLSTTQSYRHRVSVIFQTADAAPAEHCGYRVEFIVRKELEDLPRPVKSTVGGAVFRVEPGVERQTEVIDATYFDPAWIFRGRDSALEQELIRRFKNSL